MNYHTGWLLNKDDRILNEYSTIWENVNEHQIRDAEKHFISYSSFKQLWQSPLQRGVWDLATWLPGQCTHHSVCWGDKTRSTFPIHTLQKISHNPSSDDLKPLPMPFSNQNAKGTPCHPTKRGPTAPGCEEPKQAWEGQESISVAPFWQRFPTGRSCLEHQKDRGSGGGSHLAYKFLIGSCKEVCSDFITYTSLKEALMSWYYAKSGVDISSASWLSPCPLRKLPGFPPRTVLYTIVLYTITAMRRQF